VKDAFKMIREKALL